MRVTKAMLEAQVAELQDQLDQYKRAYEHVTRNGVNEYYSINGHPRYMSPAQARSNSLGWARNQMNKEKPA